MNSAKRPTATLPSNALGRIDSSRMQPRTPIPDVARPPVAAAPRRPEEKPMTMGDALTALREISAGKMPFAQRLPAMEKIFEVMMRHAAHPATDVYSNAMLELTRALHKGELPEVVVAPTVQFLLGRLDPRAVPMVPLFVRRCLKNISVAATKGVVPADALNAVAAISLYQLNADHWSLKDRMVVAECLLWTVSLHVTSELFRTGVIGRCLRLMQDRGRLAMPEETGRMAVGLASVLYRDCVPHNLVLPVFEYCVEYLKTKNAPTFELGATAIALLEFNKANPSYPLPLDELQTIANQKLVTDEYVEYIRSGIRQHSANAYQAMRR